MLVKLTFVMQRLKKIFKNFFVIINKDGRDIELMGVPLSPPPTGENPVGPKYLTYSDPDLAS